MQETLVKHLFQLMQIEKLHLCFVGNMLGRNAKYATSQGQIVADLFAEKGVKVITVSAKINRALRLLDIIRTLIVNCRRIDIVLHDTFSGLSFLTASVTAIICKLFGLPLIMVLHGGNLANFARKYPFWTKKVFDMSDSLVSPSSFLSEKFGEMGFKVEVIPNVIDIDKYSFRQRSGIEPHLIWMRSFHPLYNPEMAVKVLAKLKETIPDARLTIAGVDKGLEAKVRKMVSESNLTDAVRFPGFLDMENKLKEFSKADIYLNTNRVDNMPVSVIEACAMGLPVIATEVGGLPWLITHGENGFLVPDDDADKMADAIKILLADADLTEKISRSGRKLAERSAWKSVSSQWEKLFAKMLDKSITKAECGSNKPRLAVGEK